jgi:VanZ family protein
VSAVRRRVLLWGPVVAYMAAIYYVSAQSAPPMVGPVVSDKVAHAIAYFGFGVLTFRAIAGGLMARVTPPRAAATMILSIVYAATDEVHQLFVPGRHGDVVDVVADATGAALALLACWAWNIIATSTPRVPRA